MVCAVSFDPATCSSGSYCPEGSTVEQPCQAGSYCATPSTQVQCPENTYCPASSTAPTTCPDSKVSPPGSTSLAQCEKNSISVAFTVDGVNPTVSQSQFAAALPANVAVNSFEEVILSAQNVCPVGYYCPPDTTTPIACPAGTFNNFTNKQALVDCLVCPVGQFCPISSVLPTDCAAGSYRGTEGGVAQSSCTACPAGNYCPVASVDPSNCSAGSYRGTEGGVDQSSCTVCPSGNYCPQASVNPSNCSAGSYRGTEGGVAQSSCTACPSGNYCPQASVNPSNCSAGSYRGTEGGISQDSCTTCPSGNYCPLASVNPTNCSAGKYNTLTGQTSSAACLPCPAGDYCPIATSTPPQCAANTFTATTGAAVCDQCPIFSTSPIASTNCTCDAGHYHVVSTTGGSSGTASFSLAVVDTIYNNVAAANNFYSKFLQTGGSSHISVTKGSVVTFQSNAYGASNTVVSLRVYTGIFGPRQYFVLERDLNTSYMGYQYVDIIPHTGYQLSHASQTALSYSTGVSGQGSSTVVWDTTDVPSNLYFVGTPSITDAKAPLSVFVASATPTTITYAPYSQYTTTVFVTAACLGDTLILNKPTGNVYYAQPPLQDIFVTCVDINDESQSNPPESATVLASGPSPLTWTVAGIDDTKQCYISYGPFVDIYYSALMIYPRPAPIGEGTSSLTCSNCSSGYKSSPGAPACTECGLGYYSSPVSETCTICPVGTKCPTATTPDPVDCGVGFYQSQTGQSVCLPCPVGKYCDLARTETPTSCPAGTFRDTEGAASVGDCHTCPSGNYCPVESVNPTKCLAGTYRDTAGADNANQCLACPVGQYCELETTTPVDCSAGSYRSTTGAQSQAQCDTCTTGHYCPVKSVTPTDCAPGTFNELTGKTQASDCLVCTTGHYCPVKSVTPTDCVAGTYNPNTGSDDPTDCQVCVTGRYSLDIARPENCPLCAANSYCPNSTTIKVCPENTVSNEGSSSLLDCRCAPGFSCTYTKQITAVVTLNATATSFNDDVGGVKTAFIEAVAAAAGVPVSSVHIGSVTTSAGRRLLSFDSETITVYTTVSGATHLRNLDSHLAKHDPLLHLGHSWQEAHRVTRTSSVRRPMIYSTR